MIVITTTRFSWVSGLCLKLLEQWGERSVAVTATLRSFLISSPQLTPKESCLIMNPATRNHHVAVWKNDKVANFFQTSWALPLQVRFRLKWSPLLNNRNLMKKCSLWIRKHIWTRDYRIKWTAELFQNKKFHVQVSGNIEKDMLRSHRF